MYPGTDLNEDGKHVVNKIENTYFLYSVFSNLVCFSVRLMKHKGSFRYYFYKIAYNFIVLGLTGVLMYTQNKKGGKAFRKFLR